MTFPQQMANIGSETSRVYKALLAGKESRAESAFARFQELIDLTIKFGRLGIPCLPLRHVGRIMPLPGTILRRLSGAQSPRT